MAGYDSVRLTANISSNQFQQRDMVDLIEMILAKTGLAGNMLELEITENVPLEENELITLNKLRAMEIQISVDDFGLGSSLGNLKSLPLDTLKINQTFVRGMTTEGANSIIIASIISMAHNLDLKVVAEGVETEEQLQFLIKQRCDEVQGFLFGQPVLPEAIMGVLQTRLHLPAIPNEKLDLLGHAESARKRKIGYVLTDEHLIITASSTAINQWVESKSDNLIDQFLPDVFPELIGVESILCGVAHSQEKGFTISKIYRPSSESPEGFGCYFDLQVEPFSENGGHGLLVITADVTEQAHVEFELRQERNELRLGKISSHPQ
jgi:hypothetical protein